MKKKLTVTIGIPAYNEEKNIGHLLASILKQKNANYKIDQILVVSDCSKDETDSIVRSFKKKKVTLLRNRQRRGQSYSENLIFNESTSDVLVLFEADTLLRSVNYLDNLLKSFMKNRNIHLVQGNIAHVLPKTFIGKVISHHEHTLTKCYLRYSKKKNNISTGRGGRAFSKSLYKEVKIPTDVPEDAYIHLWCKNNGLLTEYTDEATAYYQAPQSFYDFLLSEKKILHAARSLKNRFTERQVDHHYKKGFRIACMYVICSAFANPILFLSYVFMKTAALVIVPKDTFSDFWESTRSTKQLSIIHTL
jgi:glycosyltransferase involved in cell wall biosynthesis